MADHVLSVRLDPTLFRALAEHADRAGVTTSQAVRVMLRRGLEITETPYDDAFYEAMTALAGEGYKAIGDAIARLTTDHQKQKKR